MLYIFLSESICGSDHWFWLARYIGSTRDPLKSKSKNHEAHDVCVYINICPKKNIKI